MRLHTVKIHKTVQVEGDDPLAVAMRMVRHPEGWEFWSQCAESNIPISKLNLPDCMVKHLRGRWITTVDELARHTEVELDWHNSYGFAALEELREKLRVLGFKFETR